MELKMAGIGIVALMILSLAGVVYWGVGGADSSLSLVLFSVSISLAFIFFGEWFKKEG